MSTLELKELFELKIDEINDEAILSQIKTILNVDNNIMLSTEQKNL